MKILIVEDEAGLREGLADLLRGAGHEVEQAADGPTGLRLGTLAEFDMIVLDLMLPGMDGIEVCRRLREKRPDVHVLMLTARGSEDDKVDGLQVGADDYVTKPFGARELLARIEAVKRRLGSRSDQPVAAHGCTFHFDRGAVERNGETLSLTPRETRILQLLHRHEGRPVSRSVLLEQVWGAPGNLETRTVDMTISNLRQKIEPLPSSPRIVVTVKGVGYAWGEE